MRQTPPPRARGRVPLGVLGMLALVGALEVCVWRHRLDLWPMQTWSWFWPAREASEAARYDILCFGDSLLQNAVAPPLVERASGRHGYNFALGGGQAVSSYFLLRRAFEAGARPSAIVADFFPALLQMPPERNREQWPLVLSLRDAIGFCRDARDAGQWALTLVSKALPSFRARESLRAYLGCGLGLRPASDRPALSFPTQFALRKRKEHGGALISPAGLNATADFVGWRRRYFDRIAPDPLNALYLDRFLALAAEHRVPVFWLVPPVRPELQAECDRSGFDREYTRFLQDVLARHPGVVVIDGRRAAYDARVFADPHHLGALGATAYSLALGDILKDLPSAAGGPRWIELPRYREPPADLVLEDYRRAFARRVQAMASAATARTGPAKR